MMQTWTTIDKSEWARGPWDTEPDKAQWITAAGLDGLVVRAYAGHLCGYVGVPVGHPLHGVAWPTVDLEVHGGLNFFNPCQEAATPADGICHVEQGAAHPNVWWLGFDCGHVYDKSPGMEAYMSQAFKLTGCPLPAIFTGTYRDLEYVQEQVEHLARQLVPLEEV